MIIRMNVHLMVLLILELMASEFGFSPLGGTFMDLQELKMTKVKLLVQMSKLSFIFIDIKNSLIRVRSEILENILRAMNNLSQKGLGGVKLIGRV